MAADAYLKTAAGQLQQGADALKREASHIRGEAANQRKRLENEIVSKQASAKTEQIRAQTLIDDRTQHGVLMNVQRLQNDVEDLKRQLQQTVSEAEQAASAKESAVQSLTGEAANLQQMSSDPRLK